MSAKLLAWAALSVLACLLNVTAPFATGRAAPPDASEGPNVRLHGPAAAVRAILAAEAAFNARSQQAGPAIAMREYLDPVDGLTFTGGEPARGAAAIYAAQGGDHPAGALSWVPSEVFASQGGDMGAVWGHFRFTPPSPHAAVVTGKYVTVWRRNPDGAWKGIIDIGSPD